MFASAMLASIVVGMATPSVGLAYSYQGKTYQYANNLDKANQKVEASKDKLYGVNNYAGYGSASSSKASTSYVNLLMSGTESEADFDPSSAFRDITFGGKTITGETETDYTKAKPFQVTTGRFKVNISSDFKLRKIEVGTLEADRRGNTTFVYKTVANGSQVTLGTVLPSDVRRNNLAPTKFKITYYSNSTRNSYEYIVTLYQEIKETPAVSGTSSGSAVTTSSGRSDSSEQEGSE